MLQSELRVPHAPARTDEKALASAWSSETNLSHRLEAQTESFSSHSVEFTETVSESSSTSWRTFDVQTESVSSSFDLKLSASPKLLMEMSDVQVNSGEMAEFSCSFAGQPFSGVEWDHNGQSLADTERVRSSEMGGLLSLVIRGVGVADQGVYCCTATNQHGQNSSSAQLTVEGG
ncbi:SPEG neighbor protein-like [Sebastes fasciatus]|uniref:SPEG neighbor protein-like n=1 Tax=Sebastes fasciatus TaxID=394691 RepID=UPI003D9E65B4